MMKFSKLGAAALALALSVTIFTPTTAFAKSKPEAFTKLEQVGDLIDDDVFDYNTIKVGDITGTGKNYSAALEDRNRKLVAVLLANGLATTEEPANASCSTITVDNVKYYASFSYKHANSSYSKGVYTYTYTDVSGKVYKNRLTGKTGPFKEMLNNNYSSDENVTRQFQKAIRIKKGEKTYVSISLNGGDTVIKGVKSSKKSVATAKLYNKFSLVENTNADNGISIKSETDAAGNTTYTVYYYTTVGGKVIVGTYSNRDDAEAAVKATNADDSSAVRVIALDGKKAGKTTLSFSIVNRNGRVTKVKTTVYVVGDTDVFKTFSYGGKSLLSDYYSTKNLNYGKKTSDSMWDMTTKKKGRLVIKTNPNYKIKSIEVGKLYKETITEGLKGTDRYGDEYDHSKNYSAYYSTGTTTTHREDLNGDGDYDDVVNGISEKNVTFKYTKVKSGKTIKLGTVGYNSGIDVSTTTSSRYTNSKEQYIVTDNRMNSREVAAPTSIRVTYYDKLEKRYCITTKVIYLAIRK